MAGSDAAPGVWLRLTALAATVAVALTVSSGALAFGAAHRVLAALAVPPLSALLAAAWVAHRRLLAPTAAALVLFFTAALVSGRLLHVVFAALALAATAAAAAATWRGAPVPASALRDYVTLTKPRIMSLLLLTGFCGLCVGTRGLPGIGLGAAAMAGLALACGGASALNHVLDRDLDPLMGSRTRRRPVASGRMPPTRALEFGLCLSAFSFVLLASTVNLLTAVLALVGNLFYVLVYTRLLKRRTVQNIVIGGAAGAVPPIVGYAAATGNLGLVALMLFAIVFFWTPPHFWALALLLKREYAAAGVPMLPVVRGERETTKQILLYTVALVAVTASPFVAGTLGVAYLAVALLLGGGFFALAVSLRRHPTPRRAALVFHFSLLYLALLFVAMAVDPLLS